MENFRIDNVERISAADAEKISLNRLNASLDLYDRLDYDAPTITSLRHNKNGEITITATDTKIKKYNHSMFRDVGVQEPTSEPGSYGIVGYKITEDANEPDIDWIMVEKTSQLNVTSEPVEKDGIYYVWVIDVGGNVDCDRIEVKGIESDGNGGNGGGGGNNGINPPDTPKKGEMSQSTKEVTNPINSTETLFSNIDSQVSYFESIGQTNAVKVDGSDLINNLGSILATIGIVAVLAGLLIIGIKYMFASPEQAAKLKTSLIGVSVAGAVIVGSYGIWVIVKNFLSNLKI